MRHYALVLAFLVGVLLTTAALTAGIQLPPPDSLPLPVPAPLLFDPAAEVLARENDIRVAQGLPRFKRNVRLEDDARNYAIEMAYGRFFDHVSPGGSTSQTRARDVSYPDWDLVGENLAAGQQTSVEAVMAWMNSPGHRANILSPIAKEVGIGYTHVLGSIYGSYWVEVFGPHDPNAPLSMGEVQAIITQAALAYRVSPTFLIGVAACESRLDPSAVGDHGRSVGLFQIGDLGLAPVFYADGYTDRRDATQSAVFAAREFAAGHGSAWSCFWVLKGERPPWWR